MGLQAGRLRDRITIRRRSDVKNARGGLTPTWSTVAVVWAEVVSQSGREAMVASALQGIASYKITIRHRADIRAADQVLYSPFGAAAAIELNIKSVAPDPFLPREATVIFADTETPQGA